MRLGHYLRLEMMSFIVSLCILAFMVLVPAFDQLKEGYVGVLSSLSFYEDAYKFLVLMVFVYFISFSFLCVRFGLRWTRDLSAGSFRVSLPKLRYALYLIVLSVPLWLLSVDIQELLHPVSRFHSQSPILTSVAQFSIFTAFTIAVLHTRRKPLLWLVSLLLILFYLLYPISISSRSAAFPFVMLSVYFFAARRSFLLGSISAYLVLVFLGAALKTRNSLGFSLFFQNVLYFLNPVYIYDGIKFVFPGLGSTSVAMEMFSNAHGFGLSRFLVYISPAPSFLLPDNVFAGLGFTEYLGARNIGLNTDILSEWFFWFGHADSEFIIPAFAGGLFFALLAFTPFLLIRLGFLKSFFLRLFFQISIIYFFAAGMSMSIRASSRLFVYTLFVTLFTYYTPRLRITRRIHS